MVELGQLEKQHGEFAARGIRILAVSNDDLATARKTQADFPHLTIVSDAQQNLARAVQVIHPKASIQGTDTNAPTTLLLDGQGTVRWVFRPQRFIERLTPQELAKAIDEHLPRTAAAK